MKKSFVVFNLGLANKLIEEGFRLQGTAPSKNAPGKLVFFFKDTETLRKAIEELKQLEVFNKYIIKGELNIMNGFTQLDNDLGREIGFVFQG